MSVADATDLLDAGTFAEGPPLELFERLRQERPAEAGTSPVGERLVSVCKHAEIAAISRDTDTFSSWQAGIFPHPDQVNNLELNRNLLLFKDPPEHTKYRKILQTAFVPKSVAALEDQVRAAIGGCIDAVVDAGRCDFIESIAVPYPLTVLSDLMGLPRADLPRLAGWIEGIEQAQQDPEPNTAMPIFVEMAGYLHEQIQAQKQAGEQSLVTTLAAAEVDGESLNDDEILVFFGLLIFAGNDTTRNTLGLGMAALLEHPEQLTMLRDDPTLITNAVEEILRWSTVVNYFCRTATTDTEVSGCPVAEGEKVMLWYASGSRDPEANSDPNRFNITRAEIDHQAFGGGGRHFCLGAGLARLELRLALEEILARMATIELDGEPTRLTSNWANALTSLPIKFTRTKTT